ncbi:MAG TPA: alpha/beta hydrolase [Magnetospirillaceae bacterium]|jgi:pimeloyl-ACP methyl ester carboxylesterase
MSDTEEGRLARPDGNTIAYRRTRAAVIGRNPPGIVFLHGFRSDMTGGKAQAVEAYCRGRGQACLLFDGFAHGKSSGDFAHGTIGRWAEDAAAVLDALTEGPQILVGSSFGGWIMVLAALLRPQRVAGLVGLAAAPDFTEDLILAAFKPEDRRVLDEQGQIMIPGTYDLPSYPITKNLIDEARNHLVLRGPIPITCPVRLIHGLEDADVPWQTSLTLQEKLASTDVAVTLVKGAGHRLSEPADLVRLRMTLDDLLRPTANVSRA